MSGGYLIIDTQKKLEENVMGDVALQSDVDYNIGVLQSQQSTFASKNALTQTAALVTSIESRLHQTEDAVDNPSNQDTVTRALHNSYSTAYELQAAEAALSAMIGAIQTRELRINDAMVGNIEIRLDDGDLADDVSAAELNAAAEGEFALVLATALVAKKPDGLGGYVYPAHSWCYLEPTITPGNTGCWDPTVTSEADPLGTPAFAEGVVRLVVTFATDGGVTKVYEVGDTVTVKVKVEASSTMPWAAAEVTKTYTVIA